MCHVMAYPGLKYYLGFAFVLCVQTDFTLSEVVDIWSESLCTIKQFSSSNLLFMVESITKLATHIWNMPSLHLV